MIPKLALLTNKLFKHYSILAITSDLLLSISIKLMNLCLMIFIEGLLSLCHSINDKMDLVELTEHSTE